MYGDGHDGDTVLASHIQDKVLRSLARVGSLTSTLLRLDIIVGLPVPFLAVPRLEIVLKVRCRQNFLGISGHAYPQWVITNHSSVKN